MPGITWVRACAVDGVFPATVRRRDASVSHSMVLVVARQALPSVCEPHLPVVLGGTDGTDRGGEEEGAGMALACVAMMGLHADAAHAQEYLNADPGALEPRELWSLAEGVGALLASVLYLDHWHSASCAYTTL